MDSSLRHGGWYSRVLQKIRQRLPDVRVVLLYVHAREETVYRRAMERGVAGRVVSHNEAARHTTCILVAYGDALEWQMLTPRSLVDTYELPHAQHAWNP